MKNYHKHQQQQQQKIPLTVEDHTKHHHLA
jgi:hypothetical protein